MTVLIRPDGTTIFPAASAASGIHLVTPTATRQFPTIATAMAQATAGALVLVGPGTYTESFTIPNGVDLRSSGGVATIAGTVTVAGTSILGGLILAAPAGVCVSADRGGAGNTATLDLIGCVLAPAAGGTGLLAAAIAVTVTSGLQIQAGGATGISLVAGDGAGERTLLTADWIQIEGAGVVAGIVTANGGGGGDNRVWLRVSALDLLCDTASVGVNWGTTGTQAEGFPNGAYVDTMRCVPQTPAAAASIFFRSAAGQHRIGRVTGVSLVDVIFDWNGGTGVVEDLVFPDDGLAKTTFQAADIAGGSLTFDGGRLRGGTSPLFAVTGESTLNVYNVDVEAVANGGSVLSALAAAALTGTTVVNVRGGLWRTTSTGPTLIFQGGGVGTAPSLIVQGLRVNKTGAADLLSFAHADLTLIDVNFRQNTNTNDIVNLTAAALPCGFTWKGFNFFDQDTGGAGRAITVVNAANAGLIDDGELYITRATAAEMLNAGALVSLTRRGPAQEIVSGFLATAAAVDVVGGAGVGPPGGTRSVRVVTTCWVDKTGTGVDDSITVTVENETTGVAATALMNNNPGPGVRDFQAVALSAPVLHAPGQPLRLAIALTGLGTPTDVRVAVG